MGLKEFRNARLVTPEEHLEGEYLSLETAKKLARLERKNKQLKEKINTYENPEDLTLMFMYCNEKAKDKIKQFQKIRETAINYIDQVIGYKPCAREIDEELNTLIGILRGGNNE